MSDEVTIFSVGKRYEPLATKQDGFILEWSNTSGFVLYVMLQNASAYEREQFDVTHDIDIRYTIQRGVCFFLYRFGNMPWSDSPFHPCVYGGSAVFPALEEGRGLTLNVIVVDSSLGEVLGLRLLGLGHTFSSKWLDWAAKCENISKQEYNDRVNQVYSEFESLDLANLADDIYKVVASADE